MMTCEVIVLGKAGRDVCSVKKQDNKADTTRRVDFRWQTVRKKSQSRYEDDEPAKKTRLFDVGNSVDRHLLHHAGIIRRR